MQTLQQIKIDVVEGKMPYYVYLLFKPDKTPFYVGKGKSNRISAHEAETRYFMNGRIWNGMNNFKLNTIKKIWSEEGQVFYQIDSWHDSSKEAGNREIELIKRFGRRILNEGSLTNIRTGGDLMSEEDRKLIGEKIKQFYIDHPEAREAISERLKQFYIDHPEMKDQISDSVKSYISDHPEFIENLQSGKNDWISNNPEEYAEVERRRIEIMQSDEHRDMMSEIMSQYFNDNPEECERLVVQGAEYWIDNPEARERARQNAIKNKSHESIIRWMQEEPESYQEKCERHSDLLKEWYKSNPKDAEKLAKRRNVVLRSNSHRNKMSFKTSEYMNANPEVASARVAAMKKALNAKSVVRQECLRIIQDRLFELGEITSKSDVVSGGKLCRWRNSGLLEKHFPETPVGNVNQAKWELFKEKLNDNSN